MALGDQATDESLVASARQGDLEAFAALVRRYQSMVFATTYAHLGAVEDAEDVAQDALLAGFENLPRLRSSARFASWLRGITHRLCARWHRSEAYRRVLRENLRRQANLPETTKPEDHLVAREDHVLLRQAIEALPQTLREALVLHYFGGRALSEVARYLGVSRNAAKKRLERARARLRQYLTGQIEAGLHKMRPGEGFTKRTLAAIPFGSVCGKLGLDVVVRLPGNTTSILWDTLSQLSRSLFTEGMVAMSRKAIKAATIVALAMAVGGVGYFTIKYRATGTGSVRAPARAAEQEAGVPKEEAALAPTSSEQSAQVAREPSRLSNGSKLPTDPEGYIAAAKELMSMEQYADAMAVLDGAVKSFPNADTSAEARLLKGTCLQRLGKPNEALLEFQAVIASYPDSPAAWEAARMFATLHFKGETIGEGLESVLALLDENPENRAAVKAKWNLVELAATTANETALMELLTICEEAGEQELNKLDAQLAQLALAWSLRRVDNGKALGLLESVARESADPSIAAEAMIRQASMLSMDDDSQSIALLEEVLSLPAEESIKKRAKLKLAALYAASDTPKAVLLFEEAMMEGWTERELSDALTDVVANAVEAGADAEYILTWLRTAAWGQGKLAEDASALESFIADPANSLTVKPLLQQRKIRALLSRGQYSVKIGEWVPGKKDYSYTFTLSDGEDFRVGSPQPLDDTGFQSVGQDEIEKLISQGKGELVEVKELFGGAKAYVYKVVLPDGRTVKHASTVPLVAN